MQRLLESGADVEARDNFGRTPLSSAAAKGREPVVRQLLDKGADVEAWDNSGQTSVQDHQAAKNSSCFVLLVC